MKETVDVIWERMYMFEGEQFHTTTGVPFTYNMSDDYFVPSNPVDGHKVTRKDVAKALERWPIPKPSDISTDVQGYSYVWAILNDERILGGRRK